MKYARKSVTPSCLNCSKFCLIPEKSSSQMAIGVSSNRAQYRRSLSRSALSARLRSVISRKLMTIASTFFTVSRLVNVLSIHSHEPSLCLKRYWSVGFCMRCSIRLDNAVTTMGRSSGCVYSAGLISGVSSRLKPKIFLADGLINLRLPARSINATPSGAFSVSALKRSCIC